MKMIFRKHSPVIIQEEKLRILPTSKQTKLLFPVRLRETKITHASDIAESIRDSIKLRETIKRV